MKRIHHIVLGAALATAPLGISAQGVAQVRLRPADATLPYEFTRVGALRELSDGRVIVTDAGDAKLLMGDLRAGSVTQIGRQGRGPGEYVNVRELIPLRGDTTAMPAQGGWLLIVGATLAGAKSADDPAVRALRFEILGADTFGHVYASGPTPRRADMTIADARDSSRVIRVRIRDVVVDTVARLRVRPYELQTLTSTSGLTMTRAMPPPLSAGDEAQATSDGWLAIVRVEPYAVDWVDPRGMLTRGPALPYRANRLTPADRQALVDAIPNRPDRMPPYDVTKMPELVPPFVNPALVVTRDGRALVRRTIVASSRESRYDIVDRSGRITGQLVLPLNERVIAFGTKCVYVAWKDADDIEHLRRHPWP